MALPPLMTRPKRKQEGRINFKISSLACEYPSLQLLKPSMASSCAGNLRYVGFSCICCLMPSEELGSDVMPASQISVPLAFLLPLEPSFLLPSPKTPATRRCCEMASPTVAIQVWVPWQELRLLSITPEHKQEGITTSQSKKKRNTQIDLKILGSPASSIRSATNEILLCHWAVVCGVLWIFPYDL